MISIMYMKHQLNFLLYIWICVQIYVHKRSHESEFKVNLTIVVLNSNLYCPCAGILQDDTIRRLMDNNVFNDYIMNTGLE